MEYVLKKAGIKRGEYPDEAQRIVINGRGAMNDMWMAGFDVLRRYRRLYPSLPLVVGPSTYRFRGVDFSALGAISKSPIVMFARDRMSERLVCEAVKQSHVSVYANNDLAFELTDSNFVQSLIPKCAEKHVLVAIRKDREGTAGVLARTKRAWLPRQLRRPLSRMRDWLVALKSKDVIREIIRQQGLSAKLARICRDVSVSVSFNEFVCAICDAGLIITGRLHVGIFGHLLNKPVVLFNRDYHKIRGVHEMSMAAEGSRTVLRSRLCLR